MAFIGCSDSGRDPPGASFTERDSAGIRILTTPGAEAFAPLGWEVDTVPDLVLGGEDSPSDDLYGVRGVKALPGGRVLVLNAGRNELRLFDAEGRLLERAGRRGRGPGEFISPSLVPSVRTDSVLVFDVFNYRFEVYSTDLQGHRTQRLTDWGPGRRRPVGAVGLLVLRVRRQYEAGSIEGALRAQGPARHVRTFFWYEPETGATAPLDSFPVVRIYADDDGWTPFVPFSSRPAAATSPDAGLITDGRTFEVREFDLAGELRRIFRVDTFPRPVTDEALEAKIEHEFATRLSERRRPQHEAQFSAMEIPETQPAFWTLVIDELGWLWAEVHAWDTRNPKEWVVFDPAGRARGTVQTPPGLDVRSITRDHLYGVWLGRFDVEYVHRYRLRRRGGQQSAAPGERARR